MDNNNYQNDFQNRPPDSNAKGMAIAALVCGIIGIVGGWIPVLNYFTLLASAVAIVLGVIAKKKLPAGGTGMATAGLVLGIIGAALSLSWLVCYSCLCTAAADLATWGWFY